MDRKLVEAFRFFHEHAGYVVGRRAVGALALARAEQRAKELGLSVTWDDEDLPWDGDCEPPRIHARATVLHPDHADADTSDVTIRFPFYDRRDGSRGRTPAVLAALGSIGLDSWRDSYVRVVEAELFAEALDALDAERDAATTVGAAELASRATLAGNVVQS